MLSRRTFLGGAVSAGVLAPQFTAGCRSRPAYGTRPFLQNYSAPIQFDTLPILQSSKRAISTYRKDVQETVPHVYLSFFDGLFWCMWTSTPHHTEDFGEGQEVRYAVSENGLDWSRSRSLTGLPPNGLRWIARDFWLRDGELIALASRDQIGGYFGDELKLIGHRWNGDNWESLGAVTDNSITNYAPKSLPNGSWGVSRRDHRRRVWFQYGDIRNWSFSRIPSPEGVELSEPSWVALPDGTLSMTLRVQVEIGWLYRSLSFDNGKTWTMAKQTNFPDACSKNCQRRLRDGRYILVSNPKRPDLPNRDRTPLSIAVSDDGDVFDRLAILRKDPPPRHDDQARSHTPGFMYPDVLERDGHLYIAYTTNKETIQVSRLSLGELP